MTEFDVYNLLLSVLWWPPDVVKAALAHESLIPVGLSFKPKPHVFTISLWNGCICSALLTDHRLHFSHHSSLQHTPQRPSRWFGLHLSFVSPHFRASSGATWADSLTKSTACMRNLLRTHPEKLVIRSAISAVCSSSVMVLGIFLIFLPYTTAIHMYV